MASRKPGERNWEDPIGITPAIDLPTHTPTHTPRHFQVTDQGNGWYSVTDGHDEWIVSLSCDNVLTIEERSYPNKRCDQAVIKAVQRCIP